MRVRASELTLVLSLLAVTTSCSPTPRSSAPAPAPSAAAPVVAEQPPVGERRGPPPEGAMRLRRPRPNPLLQDSLRRAMVAEVMRTIAGRENEPAGEVFKNVKLLKSMPAAEFLRNMDENYGRGLGFTCTGCHVPGQFASDERKNKRVAREMQQMTDAINAEQLAKMPDLGEHFHRATCVMCHRGSNEPPSRMAVPQPAPAPPGPMVPGGVGAPPPGSGRGGSPSGATR